MHRLRTTTTDHHHDNDQDHDPTRTTAAPEVFVNPRRGPMPDSWPVDRSPAAFHRALPGYAPTPLWRSPALAERLGVASVVVKDESSRFGLPAFKMLGASWAVYRTVAEYAGVDLDVHRSLDDLRRHAPRLPRCLTTATDGNHGRAVARLAASLGIAAEIWVPHDMSPSRIRDIVAEGAEVHVVDGPYDLAVTTAAEAAADDVLVVSDTAWEGYTQVPRWVVDGYSTIFDEIDGQLADHGWPRPNVVPLQIGVGGMANAAIRHVRRTDESATLIGVEPTEAACTLAALRAGEVVTIDGEFRTEMVGLNCGTASPIAYPYLAAGLDATMTIDDGWAESAMRLLAEEGHEVGASGASALGGLLALADHPAGDLLHPTSNVLVLTTEGVTDREHFERVTS